jgi:DNA-directed RNA polymerase subunit K/omega
MNQPSDMGKFQFVVLSSLRAAQLLRGCLPRIDGGHKTTVTAQLEISLGKVKQDLAPVVIDGAPIDLTLIAVEPTV